MGTVRLWLKVYEQRAGSLVYTLWTREMVTDFAPRAEDKIYLSFDYEENEDTVEWDVKRCYWGHGGEFNAVLVDMVVDPAEGYRYDPHSHCPWWTEQMDGRPEPWLRLGDWKIWDKN